MLLLAVYLCLCQLCGLIPYVVQVALQDSQQEKVGNENVNLIVDAISLFNIFALHHHAPSQEIVVVAQHAPSQRGVKIFAISCFLLRRRLGGG